MSKAFKPIKRINGNLSLPGDELSSHLALVLAALSKGESSIRNLSSSKHCQTTMQCLRQLGADIRVDKEQVNVLAGGLKGLNPPAQTIAFKESEITLFLLAGILSGLKGEFALEGDLCMLERLKERFLPSLEKVGVDFDFSRKGFAVINSKNQTKPISFHLDQDDPLVKTGLVVTSLLNEGFTNFIQPEERQDKTKRLLELFGVRLEVIHDQPRGCVEVIDFRKKRTPKTQKGNFRLSIEGGTDLIPQNISLPGDSLLGVFFAALAVFSKKSQIHLKDIQAEGEDFRVFEILKSMGAELSVKKTKGENNQTVAQIIASSSKPKGRKINLPCTQQAFPLLSVIACLAQGTTVIRGLSALRQGKIDLLKTTSQNLKQMGAKIGELRDGVVIEGKGGLDAAQLDAKGDLPLSLGLLLASLLAEGESELLNHQKISEHYPVLFGILDLVCEYHR